jgi:CRP-like cAMP-binding protein
MSPAIDLSKVWLFSTCSKSELRAIERKAEEVKVPAGTIVLDEGSVGMAFYLIEEGKAEVLRKGEKVAELGPGQIFGEIALLDRLPRTAAIRAITDLTLFELKQREFDEALNEAPHMTRKLLTALASRLREADARANY